MLSKQAGSNLRLKRGRSRSRGRPSTQSTPTLGEHDYDCQRMTRSRSKSRGRVPVTVKQHGENKEGIVIGSSAHMGSSAPSHLSGSSGLVCKTDRFSTTSSKILQGPRSQSQQEASSDNSAAVRTVVPLQSPYNFHTTAPRRTPLPVPVPPQKKPCSSSTVPYGLPMFSILSTPNPANQASRKRPQESVPSINYGKRHNSTEELPGCHFQTAHDQANKDAPTNARSNQMIVSPLNRLFNETSANQTPQPQHSSLSQFKIQRLSSYPDIEIIPVSANDNFDCDEEIHPTAPGKDGRVQINSKCITDAAESAIPLSSYVDARPAKRIPFPVSKERSVSTNLENSSGRQKQCSITGKEADQETGSMSTSMRLSDNVTISPVIDITDDEDDCCVSQTPYTSVSGADDAATATADNSEEAVVNHVSPVSDSSPGFVPAAPTIEMSTLDKCTQEQISGVPVMGRYNATTLIGRYDGDDDEEEQEYHDTFEEVGELHEPKKNLTDEDEETIKPKKNWCTIA